MSALVYAVGIAIGVVSTAPKASLKVTAGKDICNIYSNSETECCAKSTNRGNSADCVIVAEAAVYATARQIDSQKGYFVVNGTHYHGFAPFNVALGKGELISYVPEVGVSDGFEICAHAELLEARSPSKRQLSEAGPTCNIIAAASASSGLGASGTEHINDCSGMCCTGGTCLIGPTYINWPTGSPGYSISWPVNAAPSLNAAVEVAYSLGSCTAGQVGNRPLELHVNGVFIQTIQFICTGHWDIFVYSTPISVILQASGNQVTLTQPSNTQNGPNIDGLRICSVPAPPSPPSTPPAAPPTGAIIELTGDIPKIIFGELDNPVCTLELDRTNSRLVSTCAMQTPSGRRLDEAESPTTHQELMDLKQETDVLRSELAQVKSEMAKLKTNLDQLMQ